MRLPYRRSILDLAGLDGGTILKSRDIVSRCLIIPLGQLSSASARLTRHEPVTTKEKAPRGSRLARRDIKLERPAPAATDSLIIA